MIYNLNYNGGNWKMENQADIKWAAEANALQDQSEFWKPTEGKHTISLLSNGEFRQWNAPDGRLLDRVRFDARVDGNKVIWEIPKGSTRNSLYGQLALIGKENGKLQDQKVTLIVKGEGKNRSYIVDEALALSPKGD